MGFLDFLFKKPRRVRERENHSYICKTCGRERKGYSKTKKDGECEGCYAYRTKKVGYRRGRRVIAE